MRQVHILLGGNLGDREKKLAEARFFINKSIGKIIEVSSIYETAAWGKENQPPFLNQVIIIESNNSPIELLKKLQQTELDLGRVRHEKWSERTIDLDILFIEDLVIDTEQLKVPHPYIQERLFTLIPLSELSPSFNHPILKKRMIELKNTCTDSLPVTRYT